jgi:hypothetical protein
MNASDDELNVLFVGETVKLSMVRSKFKGIIEDVIDEKKKLKVWSKFRP